MVFARVVLSRELFDVRIFAVPWPLPEKQQINEPHKHQTKQLTIPVSTVTPGTQGFIRIADSSVKRRNQSVDQLINCNEYLLTVGFDQK